MVHKDSREILILKIIKTIFQPFTGIAFIIYVFA